jgi:hypothetical protein
MTTIFKSRRRAMIEVTVNIAKAKKTFFRAVRPGGFWQKAYP